MKASLVPAYSATRLLGSSGKDSLSETGSSARAIAIVLGLLARFLGVLLLVGLFAVAGLVWIWLASFRSGWRLGDWLDAQDDGNQEKLSLDLLHNTIVVILVPLALFGDWAEKLIHERFQLQFPSQQDIRQIVEKQLGIKFAENSPCLPKQLDASASATTDQLK